MNIFGFIWGVILLTIMGFFAWQSTLVVHYNKQRARQKEQKYEKIKS
jgi:amino acid permease